MGRRAWVFGLAALGVDVRGFAIFFPGLGAPGIEFFGFGVRGLGVQGLLRCLGVEGLRASGSRRRAASFGFELGVARAPALKLRAGAPRGKDRAARRDLFSRPPIALEGQGAPLAVKMTTSSSP